jgi:ankyrin repeat protein
MGDLVEFEVVGRNPRKGMVFLPSKCSWLTLTDLIRMRLNIEAEISIEGVSVVDKITGDQLTSWSDTKPLKIPDMSTFKCLVLLSDGEPLLRNLTCAAYESEEDTPPIHQHRTSVVEKHVESDRYNSDDANTQAASVEAEAKKNAAPVQVSSMVRTHTFTEKTYVPFVEMVSNEVPSPKQFVDSSNSIFVDICTKGNTSAVLSALSSPVSFVSQSELDRGMIAACTHGHVATAHALHDHAVSVDVTCESNDITPLHHAALRNHPQVCSWLMKEGASPLRMNSWGTCALHYFCINGMTDMLVNLGLKMLDTRSAGGRTGLHFAAGFGHLDTVVALAEHGANLNAADDNGNTPLHYASEMGMTATVKALLRNRLDSGVALDAANEHGATPILSACRAGHLDVAVVLSSNGANCFAEDKRWQGCMHYASLSGSIPLLSWLIKDIGHNPGGVDRDGLTPVDVALKAGHVKAVEFLRAQLVNEFGYVPNGDAAAVPSSKKHTPVLSASAKRRVHKPLQKAAKSSRNDEDDYEDDDTESDDEDSYRYRQAQQSKAAMLTANGSGRSISEVSRAPVSKSAYGKSLHVMVSESDDEDAFQFQRSQQNKAATHAGEGSEHSAGDDWLPNKIVAAGKGRMSLEKEAEVSDAVPKTSLETSSKKSASSGPTGVGRSSDSATTVFLIACTSGDLKNVLIHLDNGIDVAVSNENGSQGIHYACVSGHLAVVKCLLDRGADINATNSGGNTPLHFACQQCQVQVIKWIVSNGASVLAMNSHGATPIHYLCFHGDTALVAFQWFADTHIDMRYFMANADADRRYLTAGWPSFTLLHSACEAEGSLLIAAVIAAGVSVTDKNDRGQTALHILVGRDNIDGLKEVLDHPDCASIVNATENDGKTALFEACLLGNIKAAKYLVAHDADTNIRNEKGNSCLHAACQSGNFKLVKWLVEIGADINVVNCSGYRPVDFAEKARDETTVGYLQSLHAIDDEIATSIYTLCLRKDVSRLREMKAIGYDILNVIQSSSPLTNDSSPLHIVCHRGLSEVVEYLHETFSVSLAQLDTLGCSPLHYAVIGGHVSLVLWMIAHGAWALEPTSGGRTSMHLAAKYGHLTIINALVAKGVSVDCRSSSGTTPVFDACSAGLLEVMKHLIDSGACREAVDNNNRNLVHYGCESGNSEIIMYLIDLGLDIDRADKDGMTPLLFACEHGQLSICELLLSRGCSLYQKGSSVDPEDSALHIAARHGHINIVQWLVACGVSPQCLNSKGHLPAEVAVFERHHDICDWLEAEENIMEKSDLLSTVLEPQLSWAICNNFIRLARGCLDEIIAIYPVPREYETADGSTLLHTAAAVGNHLIVDTLVNSKGCDVDKRSNDGWSAVHVASSKGYLDVIKALKAEGAKMKGRDANGNTPLHVAADFGHVNVVQYFAKSLKNLDLTNTSGWTAIHYAASHGYEDITKVLVECGASGRVVAEGGITPLHLACHERHLSLACYLVETNSADIRAKDDEGATAAILARESGMTAVADWLERLAEGASMDELIDPRILSYEGATSVQQQIAYADDEVGYTVEHDAPPPAPPPASTLSPYYLSCVSDVISTTRPMEPESYHSVSSHQNGSADKTKATSAIEVYSNDEIVLNKSFIEAIESGDIAMANSLFVAGADPLFATPTSKNTALHIACMLGNIIAVKYLCDRGSDLTAKNLGGLTPLHVACDREFSEIALYLLREGAPLGAVDKAGQTPLHLLTTRGMAEVVRALPTLPSKLIRSQDVNMKTSSCQTALHLGIAGGQSDLLEDLLRLDIVVDGSDSDGQTALHIACAMGNLQAALLLLSKGANPNIADSLGKSALYFACVTGNIKLVQALVDHNGIIECRTRNGDTLLHAACQHGKLLLSKWLVSCGLDPTQKNHQKKTPKDYAMECGNAAMMEWIYGLK